MTRPKPSWRPPARDGVNASCVATPQAAAGRWPTLLDFLAERLPPISRAAWALRLARGEVLDTLGEPLSPQAPFVPARLFWYWRQIDDEPVVPFEVEVLYQDEHLVVADKPHFMTISPKGRYARETVQARLQRHLGIDTLSPIHRLDRETAGVVVFCVQPATRQRYQALFSDRQVRKVYEAVAPVVPPGLPLPAERRSRLALGDGPMQMVEVPGEPNAHTRIELLAQHGGWGWYRLHPLTGRTHQLRVHMNALGLPLRGDRIYPVLQPESPAGTPPDYRDPLQLLARSIHFIDPITGDERHFSSRRVLAGVAGALAAAADQPGVAVSDTS